MGKLLQDEDFVYSLPMLSVMMVKRLFRHLTPWARKTNVKIEYGFMPSAELQHIDSYKWEYFITLSFDRALPPIGWDRTGDFNSLLLLTESDRLMIGVHFITIFTDNPSKYDRNELILTACKAFDLQLEQVPETDLW